MSSPVSAVSSVVPGAAIRAALAYAALGALGLSFAIPPGYASPIFPAAGFAVAALLHWGPPAWVGIWLGSLALNVGTSWLQGGLSVSALLIAAGIASGAAAQAASARRMILRHVGNGWQDMAAARDVSLSLLVAGPVACAISASAGVTALYLGGIVNGRDFLYSWANWWLGDTLGVLVLLPLSLIVFYRAEPIWRSRIAIMVVPMTVALAVVGAAFYLASGWERTRQKQDIQKHGEQLAQLLTQRFIAHQEALSALRRVIEVAPDIDYPRFDHFTRITLKDNPDIFALSFNPYVTLPRRATFEREMAARTGVAGFEIRERNAQGALMRAAAREAYVAVGYIAPLEGNRPAVGYDIHSEPVRHAAIERAIASREAVVTSPIQLVQENRKRVGVLALHPAYAQGARAGQGAQGDLVGFAVGVVKVDEMVEIATRGAKQRGLVFRLDDTLASADRSLLYRSEATAVAADAFFRWERQLTMSDRVWRLTVAPTDEYLGRRHHWLGLAVGAGGLALAALLQVLLLTTTGSTDTVRRKVREQTAELAAKGAALEDRNAQMDALFRLSPDAIVAFAPGGMVKYANPAFRDMTGIDSGDIVGQSEDALDRRLRACCAQPDAFGGVAAYFAETVEGPSPASLTLARPRHTVLQIVGIRSEASSVARILYLRDITHETEVDRLKSEFLAHAAHELRTPMSGIYGFAELMLVQEFSAEERREFIETIYRQSKRMIEIINELLDLMRIEEGRGKDFRFERVDAARILADIVADFVPPRGRAAPRWQAGEGSCTIRVDPAKLIQAVGNVLSNAYKYSPAGGEVEASLVLADEGTRVGLRVADHGIGMAPEQLARVSERFYRADSSGKIPGTGLGMSIVREIIELHGGRVELESKVGAGSTVTLWLPAAGEPVSEPEEVKS